VATTSSLRAIWSSCSPEFGIGTVLDRFRQLEPKVLHAVDGYRYGGRDVERGETISRLAWFVAFARSRAGLVDEAGSVRSSS
jgi:acetoacetyl-CoA synthetase